MTNGSIYALITGNTNRSGNMTKEEAIKVIKIIEKRYITLYDEERQALFMAIKVLEEQKPCEDCIRKQDEIRKAYDKGIENGLISMETCEDCISRQAVINAIYANGVWENEYNLTSSRIKKAVEKLPSVNPQEPKIGHWVMHIDDLWPEDSTQECNICHAMQSIYIADDNYCPNCGAKMQAESEEK